MHGEDAGEDVNLERQRDSKGFGDKDHRQCC